MISHIGIQLIAVYIHFFGIIGFYLHPYWKIRESLFSISCVKNDQMLPLNGLGIVCLIPGCVMHLASMLMTPFGGNCHAKIFF